MSARVIPARTVDQRTTALAQANAVRLSCAAVKREIAALTRAEGCARLIELLDRPSDTVGALKLSHMFGAVTRLQRRNWLPWLAEAKIVSEDCRVREITLRQRSVLVGCLGRLVESA